MTSFVLSLFLVQCSQKSTEPIKKEEPKKEVAKQTSPIKKKCYFPDDPMIEAPLWICTPVISDKYYSAVGIAGPELSQHGILFQQDVAWADAIEKLAFSIQTKVKVRLVDHIKNDLESEFLYETIQETLQSFIVDEQLQKKWSPKRTLYLLISMEKSQVLDITDQVKKQLLD